MVRRGVPARNWSMNVTERATPSARPADARSPFVRLAELLAGIEPGQPAINIAVGEPQHPIPSFVGPVLAAHLADFGRYPANAGTDRYRRVAQFTDAFFSKFKDFQKPARHSKWRETNLASTLKGWRRFPAAEEWLAKNADRLSTASAPAGIDPAIVRTQAAKAAHNDPSEQERLLQQFMEWANSQKR